MKCFCNMNIENVRNDMFVLVGVLREWACLLVFMCRHSCAHMIGVGISNICYYNIFL